MFLPSPLLKKLLFHCLRFPAGSETMWALLDKLSKINNFTSYSDSAEVKQVRQQERDGSGPIFLGLDWTRPSYFLLGLFGAPTNY
jgi:hypothetical protein